MKKSREHKKIKQYDYAIELFEKAKAYVENIHQENTYGKTEKIISLLAESVSHKKNREFEESIELLEEAKNNIS